MNTQANTTGITNIYNLIILDESGSMTSIYESALGGANETIQTIRTAQASADDQKHYLTFVTFDSGNRESVRTIIDTKPITEVKDLTRDDYNPNGCTPLYDAMGISLTRLEKKVTDDDQVLVTIITDGMENSSSEYSGLQIKELVARLRSKGWTFVYIGANQDAVEVARSMHIDNAMNFKATDADTRRMWKDYHDSNQAYYEKVRRAKMRGERVFEDKEFFAGKLQDGTSDAGRITPDMISNLDSGQIFVFGTNVAGRHDGGAAGYACRHFGAVYGNPSGPQGQCYAIPTVGCPMGEMFRAIEEFIYYAETHPALTFLVTKIGCGNGGYHPRDIAPMFRGALNVTNIHLPAEFWRYLNPIY